MRVRVNLRTNARTRLLWGRRGRTRYKKYLILQPLPGPLARSRSCPCLAPRPLPHRLNQKQVCTPSCSLARCCSCFILKGNYDFFYTVHLFLCCCFIDLRLVHPWHGGLTKAQVKQKFKRQERGKKKEKERKKSTAPSPTTFLMKFL